MTQATSLNITAERHPFAHKIQNWARWANSGPAAGHCASIEHRYRPERLTEAEGVDRAAKHGIEKLDLQDAEMVEQAVCALASPRDARMLAARFIFRESDRRICRDFEVRYRDLQLRLFAIISEVEMHYHHVCECYANRPGLKVQRHRIGPVIGYGRTTR